MSRPLRTKYIGESWVLWAALGVGCLLFGWFRVWVVGELDTSQFRQIIDLLPQDWRRFASVDFDWLVSYLGRTATTLDEPMLISLICGWAIIRGSDVVSGELSRGTLEMVLSQPISRRGLYWSHAGYTLLGLAGLVLLVWLGMAIGIWTATVEETRRPELWLPLVDYRLPLPWLPSQTETVAMSSQVNPWAYWPGLVNLLSIGVFFASLSALISAADRYRWRTLGILIAFYFTSAGMKVLGMGSLRWGWLEYCGIFGLYHPANAIQAWDAQPETLLWLYRYSETGATQAPGWVLNVGLPLLLGGFCYWLGARVFLRRDLPAPV